MAYSIVVWTHLDSGARELLRSSLPRDQVHFADQFRPSSSDNEALGNAEIAFGNVPAARLSGCHRLRWMQLESVGIEDYVRLPVPSRLAITNLKGMFEWPAAETALAGVLALGRGLRRLIPAQAETQWVELEVRPETWVLHGKRAVVLGAGSIGRRVRRLLEAFECEVQAFARGSPDATLHTLADLTAQVALSDLVICCLPLTPETTGLVSRGLLEAMPSTCIFVNIGRGAVVDEAALVERLQQRRLRGAVIDVTAEEPIPPQNPLWHCPNTLLTQHTGGGYGEELSDKVRFFLKNLEHYRSGRPLLNRVDLEKGY